MSDDGQNSAEKELAKKNIRLAIILGLIAAGFYIGFVLWYILLNTFGLQNDIKYNLKNTYFI